MFIKKKIIAALITTGLFLFLLYGWFQLSNRYSTNKMPESLASLTYLETNHFLDLPGFELFDLDLKPISIKDLKAQNKVYILSFWASWCEPCAEEFPSMVKLIEAYPQGVEILAVSNDSSREDIETFSKAFELSGKPQIRLLWDKDKALAQLLKVDRLPESFVFNKQGRLVRKVVGSRDWAAPDAMAFFSELTESLK